MAAPRATPENGCQSRSAAILSAQTQAATQRLHLAQAAAETSSRRIYYVHAANSDPINRQLRSRNTFVQAPTHSGGVVTSCLRGHASACRGCTATAPELHMLPLRHRGYSECACSLRQSPCARIACTQRGHVGTLDARSGPRPAAEMTLFDQSLQSDSEGLSSPRRRPPPPPRLWGDSTAI